jgi:polar amino acid transport system permease protein
MSYDWDFYFVWKNLDVLLKGLVISLELTLISIALALPFGFIIAVLRLSRNFVVSKTAAAYIEFFRCTPALVQIIWIYYCLPIILGIEISGFMCGIAALVLNLTAFNAEAFRSGIQAVPHDQIDATVALGLSPVHRTLYVILPQAVRMVIPVLLTNGVGIFQQSSLVSTVAIADLMYEGRVLATRFYRPLEILTVVAIIYLIIAFPMTQFVRVIEVRLKKKLER